MTVRFHALRGRGVDSEGEPRHAARRILGGVLGRRGLELVRHAALPLELSTELDPMVREKYVEIWNATRKGGDDDD